MKIKATCWFIFTIIIFGIVGVAKQYDIDALVCGGTFIGILGLLAFIINYLEGE